MRTLSRFILLASVCALVLSGCKTGPSPEAQVKKMDEEEQIAKQQKEFAKSLPPVKNPGEGQ